MAVRIGTITVALALLPALATAGLPSRAGVAEALLGHWEIASDRLGELASPDRAGRYFLGEALLEEGRKEEALAILRELSGTAGAFSGPALEMAVRLLFGDGRYREVVAVSEEARADRFQEEGRLRYQIGQSYFLLHQPEKAKSQLEKVGAGPFLPYALYTLAQVAQGEGRALDAVGILGRAIEAASGLSDSAVAASLADRVRLTRGRMIYQAAVGQGSLSASDRKRLLDLSLSQFKRIGRESLFYADALRGIGWCSLEGGDSAKAIGAFEQAASLDPENRSQDLWAQGRVYQRLGFYDEAARLYGEARRAAEAASADLAQPAAVDQALSDGEWGRLSEAAARVRERVSPLEREENEVRAALESRRKRVEAVREQLGAARGSATRYNEELADLEKNLETYLDAASYSALFPLSERPRLEAIVARQDRVLRELTTLEEVVIRFAESGAWKGIRPGEERRAAALWRRIDKAKATLSRSQLAFLEGLKGRVSAREEELTRVIEGRKAEVASIDPGVARALRAVDGEERRLSAIRERLEVLARRRQEVSRGLETLAVDVRRARNEAARDVVAQRAEALRLRADAYTLDETEALHLWEEQGRGRPTGSRP